MVIIKPKKSFWNFFNDWTLTDVSVGISPLILLMIIILLDFPLLTITVVATLALMVLIKTMMVVPRLGRMVMRTAFFLGQVGILCKILHYIFII